MGLRDRLRARQLPTASVQLAVDPAAHLHAEQELAEASWELEHARSRGSVDMAALRARVSAAQDAFDALEFEDVTVRALPPSEWEALLDLHPPAEDQRGGERWNVQTFRPALLAVSVVPAQGDEPMTESDWEQLAKEGSIAAGELGMLFDAAVSLNLRTPATSVGKGS